MSQESESATSQQLATCLVTIADTNERQQFLTQRRDALCLAVVEALKAYADAELLHNAGRAREIAGISAEVAAWIDDPLAKPTSLWAMGNALLYLGHFRECLDSYECARIGFAQNDKELQVARLYINQVAALRHLGEYDEALDAANKARKLLDRRGPTRYAATLEMNVSTIFYERGHYEQALAACRRCRDLFVTLGDHVQAARADMNSAIILENLDRFEQAETLHTSARAVLQSAGMTQEVARSDLNLGVLNFRQARYQEALRVLQQARDCFASLDNELEVVVVDLYRAQVYLALNLLPEALSLAQQCRREFSTRGMKRQAALAFVVEGTAHRGMGHVAAALQSFDHGRRLFWQRGAVVEVALVDLERATLKRLADSPASAQRISHRASKILDKHNLTVRVAQARVLQAWCTLDLGRPDQAQTLVYAALDEISQYSLMPLIYHAHYALGRAYEAQGQTESAYQAYLAAVKATEQMQSTLWADEFRATFLQDKLALYEDIVRLSLSLNKLQEAFDLAAYANVTTQIGLTYQELARAPDKAGKQLLEQLRTLRRTWHWKHSQLGSASDVESDSDPERSAGAEAAVWQDLVALEAQISELMRRRQVSQHSLLRPLPKEYALDLVQHTLDENAVLVQYYVLDGQLGAFVVCQQGIEYLANLGDAGKVAQLVKNWRLGLDSLRLYPRDYVRSNLASLCTDAQLHLRRFYDILIAPLVTLFPLDRSQPGAQPIRLHIRLHPSLNGIPFAALFDGDQYLLERYQIVYLVGGLVPSLQPSRVYSPLVIGYSDGGRMPFAIKEAERVAEAFSAHSNSQPPRLLTEDAATEADFATYSQQANIIHLATYAAFRADNPFFSWIRLADARPTVTDLYGLRLANHPLVTLSACETGLGGWHGGGLISLCRALMVAGARGVLASLWKVDDISTAELMACFYGHLLAGKTASASLRAAQLAILKKRQHPLHWAGFVLVERAE
ncbi:MAG: CHAT domain-containing protein [Anaerolineae bacterium]|nr:CHAT domain-containing protein [Anaerolineae bacterium]